MGHPPGVAAHSLLSSQLSILRGLKGNGGGFLSFGTGRDTAAAQPKKVGTSMGCPTPISPPAILAVGRFLGHRASARPAAKSANELAGELFGYPAHQVDRTLAGILELWEGKTRNPEVLLFGPKKKR
jgi:hypothetical protein